MGFESRQPYPLIHTTYFKLADRSAETFDRFVQYCHKYLSGHDGMTQFSLGARAVEMERPVNDRDFDIVMNQLFENMESYEKYLRHQRHEEWITIAGSMSIARRVFDSYWIEYP